jgi:hypothetical protein
VTVLGFGLGGAAVTAAIHGGFAREMVPVKRVRGNGFRFELNVSELAVGEHELIVASAGLTEHVEFFLGDRSRARWEWGVLEPDGYKHFINGNVMLTGFGVFFVLAVLKVVPWWRFERVRRALGAGAAAPSGSSVPTCSDPEDMPEAGLLQRVADDWTRLRFVPTWLWAVAAVEVLLWPAAPLMFAHVGLEAPVLCGVFMWGFTADGKLRYEATPALWLAEYYAVFVWPFLNLLGNRFDPRRGRVRVRLLRSVAELAMEFGGLLNVGSTMWTTDRGFSLATSPLFWASVVVFALSAGVFATACVRERQFRAMEDELPGDVFESLVAPPAGDLE